MCQGGEHGRRHVLEPRHEVRLHARPEERREPRHRRDGQRQRVHQRAGLEHGEGRLAPLPQGRHPADLRTQLVPQHDRRAMRDAGDRHEAVGGRAARRDHPDQRPFAVTDDDDLREPDVAAQLRDPGHGVVGVRVEALVRFAPARRAARTDPALVVAQRRDPFDGERVGEQLVRVVLARQPKDIAVAVGRPGAGDDEHDRYFTGRRGDDERAVNRAGRRGELDRLRRQRKKTEKGQHAQSLAPSCAGGDQGAGEHRSPE